MRLPHTVAGVLAGLLAASCAVADPSRPLAADDPAQGSGWRPPPSPTAGVRSFAPVAAKDWLKSGGASGDSGGAMGGMDMKAMPDMGGSR